MTSVRLALRRVSAGALLGSAALLPSCASCATARCGVEPGRPRFGESAERLYHNVLRLPDWTTHEVSRRSGLLLIGGERLVDGREREWDDTVDRTVGLFPAAVEDFDHHGGGLLDFLGRQGQRVGQDSCCFFDRAWHSIKLAAE